MIRRRKRHAHMWNLTRWAHDYRHLDFDNPHVGNGRHRANA